MDAMSGVLPQPLVFEEESDRVPAPGRLLLEGPASDRVKQAIQRNGSLGGNSEGTLEIRWAQAEELPSLGSDESYALVIDENGATINAATIWGALHGVTTLAQLVQEDTLPCCRIEDRPRFSWRGLMLDPARHFLSAASLLQVIDGMAALKLNVLHLHLTDDQGFRFPSRAFPRLASEQHYTEQELRDLVAQAADRGVRVVPEIDIPGHVTSWLVAYPHWGTGNVEASSRFGVHPGCLNVTDPIVLDAVDTLLAEVADVFPDAYLHIGGDEVSAKWWDASSEVQAFMSQRDLSDARALQNHFLCHVTNTIAGLGRTPIGWDEVLHTDMPEGITVQNWRGASSRDRALSSGCDCIVSAPYYLDLSYPSDVHYGFDPAAPEAELIEREDALFVDRRFAHVAQGMRWTEFWRKPIELPQGRETGRVLGGEACLWGELVDEGTLWNRLWPRLPAIAERFWSQDMDEQRLYAWLNRDGGVTGDLLDLCEPVKWYGRLLGEVALAARIRGEEMPQARPYDLSTPLNRPVDFLPSESLSARIVLTCSDEELVDLCAQWQTQVGTDVPELEEVFDAIGRASELLAAHLRKEKDVTEVREALERLYRPYGEYMPAVIHHMLERLA